MRNRSADNDARRLALRHQSHEAALREIAALTLDHQDHSVMGRVYDLANGALWFMSGSDR